MNPITIELTAMSARLRAMFPEAESVQLVSHMGQINVDVHRIGEASAVEMLNRHDLTATLTPGNDVDYVEAEADGVSFCVYQRREAVEEMV